MKKFTSIAVLMITATLLVGCPKKPTIVKEEAKAPVAEVKSEAKAKEEAEAKARAEAEAKAREEAEAKAKAEAAERAKAEAKVKEEFRLEDIHFDLDKYDIKDKDREILSNLADWLSKDKSVKIEIEGHCDERGTNEYNLALGERRANSAKKYLVTLGIQASRIGTISYGEEKPLCTESSEECWLKNRRGHFVIQEKR